MKYPYLLLVLILFITGCGPSVEDQATMTATALTATAASWTLTPTVTNTATATPTVTLTPTPTETLTPTPSETPSQTPTITPTSTNTPDPNRYFAPDGSYSFRGLVGWEPEDVGMAQPVLLGPNVGDFVVNLVFVEEQSPFPVTFYAAIVQGDVEESFQNVTQISEDFLFTDEGKDYFRWALTNFQQGQTVHQVFYFFESGEWKLIVIYTRPENQGLEYDDLVDEAMQSMQYKR